MKRVAAVVAAAGFGRRFGPDRKLYAPLAGRPVLAWVLDTLAALPLTETVVVLAPDDKAGADLVAERAPIRRVENPTPAAGMGSSISVGVRTLDQIFDGLFIVLGDMPMAAPATYRLLMARFADAAPSSILIPVHHGQRGHPVLFDVAYTPGLSTLTGDQGARDVLKLAGPRLIAVDTADPGVLLDIDTPDELAAATRLHEVRR